MEFIPTAIEGCFEIRPRIFADERGTFVKTFHRDTFASRGLEVDFSEQFYSTSRQGVLRGLHFQRPPADHAKLVTCVAGAILDVAVDLRVGSATFGGHVAVELRAELGNMLYVPRGMAHGFLTASAFATVLYNVSSMHSPEHDAGILWSSAGIAWPVAKPIVSARDSGFPALAEFRSPFRAGGV